MCLAENEVIFGCFSVVQRPEGVVTDVEGNHFRPLVGQLGEGDFPLGP